MTRPSGPGHQDQTIMTALSVFHISRALSSTWRHASVAYTYSLREYMAAQNQKAASRDSSDHGLAIHKPCLLGRGDSRLWHGNWWGGPCTMHTDRTPSVCVYVCVCVCVVVCALIWAPCRSMEEMDDRTAALQGQRLELKQPSLAGGHLDYVLICDWTCNQPATVCKESHGQAPGDIHTHASCGDIQTHASCGDIHTQTRLVVTYTHASCGDIHTRLVVTYAHASCQDVHTHALCGDTHTQNLVVTHTHIHTQEFVVTHTHVFVSASLGDHTCSPTHWTDIGAARIRYSFVLNHGNFIHAHECTHALHTQKHTSPLPPPPPHTHTTHTYTHTHTHTRTHTHIHTCIHTHAHTHTHTPWAAQRP